MSPFQEFRLWARRAPAGERVSATAAAAVVLALLVWVLIPANSASHPVGSAGTSSLNQPGSPLSGATTAPTTPATSGSAGNPSGGGTGLPNGTSSIGGNPSIGGSTVPNSAPTSSSNSGGKHATTKNTTTSSGTKCTNPSGSVPGITAKQIKVAVVIVNIGGAAANSAFGIATPASQKTAFGAAIAAQNKHGGIDCRQVVPDYFTGNPTDQSNLQQTCLSIVAAKVFAVMDSGAYAQFPQVDCFAQHHTPYFGGYLLPTSQLTKFAPYLFEFNSLDAVYHDTIYALAKRGFFQASHGFKKLGILYRDCYPQLLSEEKAQLAQAGVSSSQIVTADVGCPSAYANPLDLEQAAVKFREAGVTNFTYVGDVGDFATFTTIASQQKFHPIFGLPDDSLITTSYGSNRPNPNEINGAIAISASRDGEERTPGIKPTGATRRCSAILQKAGLPSVYKGPAAIGNACDQTWMMAAAIDHAPILAQNEMEVGLQRAKSVNFSFPQGPNDFSSGKVTWAGQFYRTTQFHASCKCWQLTETGFTRGFS